MASESPSFNELQQLQLRAQILVYGALAQGAVPEEALMVGAFSDTSTGLDDANLDDGRIFWEAPWHKALERLNGVLTVASPQGRAKLNTWRPSSGAASAIERRPIANRTLLQGFQTVPPLDAALPNDGFNMHEQRTKSELQNAQSIAESIVEHCDLLHGHLRQRCSETRSQAELAAAAFAMQAAASAAQAAAGAAKVAYDAVSQALSSNDNDNADADCSFSEDVQGVNHAVGLVFTAVFQAQTALSCGSKSWSPPKGTPVQAQFAIEPIQQDNLKEGVRLEVMPEHSRVWRPAKVLAVHEGVVHVGYESDDEKEWIPLSTKSAHRPRLRLPYPKGHSLDKLARTWICGDLVDARVGNGWREGIVTSVSREEDSTVVFCPGESIILSSKACDLRPSLLWKEGKWVLGLVGGGQDAGDLGGGNSGPPTSYKVKKLIDVIGTGIGIGVGVESHKLEAAGKKMRNVKQHAAPASKLVSTPSKSKVSKAKKLIEKATLVSKARGVDASRAITRGQLLREMLKAGSRKRSAAATTVAQDLQQRPQRRKQPTTKLLEGLQTSFDGGNQHS